VKKTARVKKTMKMTQDIQNKLHIQEIPISKRLEQPLSIFKDVTSKETGRKRILTLKSFFDHIQNNEQLKKSSQELIELRKKDNSKYKDKRDKENPCFIPGLFEKRAAKGVKSYLPLLCIDIDKTSFLGPDPGLIEDRIKSLSKIPYVFAAFPSPSLTGVRVLVWTNSTLKTHEKVYLALCSDLSDKLQIPVSSQGGDDNEHIDRSTQNLARVFFFNHVPKDLFYLNHESQVFYFKTNQASNENHFENHTHTESDQGSNEIITDDHRVKACWIKFENSVSDGSNSRNEMGFALLCHMIEHGVSSDNRMLSEVLQLNYKEYKDHEYSESEARKSLKSAKSTTYRKYSDENIVNYLAKIERGNNSTKAANQKKGDNLDEIKKHILQVVRMKRGQIGKKGGYKTPEDAQKSTASYLKKMDDLQGPEIEKQIQEAFEIKWEELLTITVQDELYEIKRELSKTYDFRFNSITLVTDYKRKNSRKWEPMDDYVFNSIVVELKSKGVKSAGKDNVAMLLSSDLVPQVDPITEYFKSLRWDGIHHIGDLCMTVDPKGANEEASRKMFEKYLTKWLVAAIANVFDKNRCRNHQCFIISGKQGIGKSFWFENLCPKQLKDYYIEESVDPDSKDSKIQTATNFIFNLDDYFAGISNKKINEFKGIITKNFVKQRSPYGRFDIHRPKICSFVASSNEPQFLHDKTGNRRFVPFEVKAIHRKKVENVNIEQVWAEAYELFKKGFQYWLNNEDKKELNEHNSQFEVQSAEYEMLTTYFRPPAEGEEPDSFYSTTEIQNRIEERHPKLKLSNKKLGEALNQLGFERIQRRRNGKRMWGYFVIADRSEEDETPKN
jgi:predicted P-loop ATPase